MKTLILALLVVGLTGCTPPPSPLPETKTIDNVKTLEGCTVTRLYIYGNYHYVYRCPQATTTTNVCGKLCEVFATAIDENQQ